MTHPDHSHRPSAERTPRRLTATRRRWIALLVLAVFVPIFPPSAAADGGRTGDTAEAVERGRRMFRVYCGSCHGLEARGDGPTADLLRIPPPDLTTLRQRSDGTFPADEVHRIIDGREQLRAHGSREMPIWGIGLQDLSRDNDQESDVAGRINDLVRFLASIQQ